MKSIGIFGGSFDPPHKGHLALAQHLQAHSGAEHVFVLPAASSPFKAGTVASDQDRLSLCRLTFKEPDFTVSDWELQRGGKSYTIDTLLHFHACYPEARLFLFLGSDMFLSLARWHRYEEILQLCTPVAAYRTYEEMLPYLMERYASKTLHLDYGAYLICDEPPFPVSSTEIREKIRKNADVSPYLTEEVLTRIRTEGLYAD